MISCIILLVSSQMKIIVDEREVTLYDKMESLLPETTTISVTKQVLLLGDIAINQDDDSPVCLIERKSLADLLASIKDGRYEEQSHRLINASGYHSHNIIYIIEGLTSQLRSPAEKKMVYSAITSLNMFKGFSVLRTSSVQETAELILAMTDKISRNFSKNLPLANNQSKNLPLANVLSDQTVMIQPVESTNTLVHLENTTSLPQNTTQQNYVNFVKKVKKDNITPENIGEIILSQIPGISSVTALAIMKTHGTFPRLIDALRENPNCLDNTMSDVSGGKQRKISKTCIANIKLFLRGTECTLSEGHSSL
jgi:ERCC4-type nuclease